ncbi:MAG: PIN domain-containing protein [Gammaproteobacteria bacterium]|nr:PIN domain-containing protein [Gammaproteobacteria bacterium]
MRRLFLDANALFTAAHNPRGKAALVISLAANGLWQIATSSYAVEEARRNLQQKYSQSISTSEAQLAHIQVYTSGKGTHCPLSLPQKDRPIFESALSCGATHLLTGDLKDFGRHMNNPKKSEGILIQTIAEFLDQEIENPQR